MPKQGYRKPVKLGANPSGVARAFYFSIQPDAIRAVISMDESARRFMPRLAVKVGENSRVFS